MKASAIVAMDPEVMNGAPCFAGTRVPVRSLLDHIEAGDGLDGFLEDFPTVARAQAIGFLERASATFLASVKSRQIDLQERFQCEDIAWVVAEAKPLLGHVGVELVATKERAEAEKELAEEYTGKVKDYSWPYDHPQLRVIANLAPAGVCLFHRTWAGNVFVDYVATHPRCSAPAALIAGIGSGLIYGLCAAATRLQAKILWGETTASSAGFYATIFSLRRRSDRLIVLPNMMTAFARKMENRWTQALA